MTQNIHKPIKTVMTTSPVTVTPETSVTEAVRLMLEHGVSGLPVVDRSGSLVGILSEADFLAAAESADREQRRDILVALMSGGEGLSQTYLNHLAERAGEVGHVMTKTVVTVDEETAIDAVAALMSRHRIKRVPVLRDGRLVGIVTRADLIGALAGRTTESASLAPVWRGTTVRHRPAAAPAVQAPAAVAAPSPDVLTADLLRRTVSDYHRSQSDALTEARRDADRRRLAEVEALLDNAFEQEELRHLLDLAARQASQGATEVSALRFPVQLCDDGGRAINNGDPEWPTTLRGKAASFFARWQEDLRPKGFRLAARIVSFPGGVPGEVELTLVWGREQAA